MLLLPKLGHDTSIILVREQRSTLAQCVVFVLSARAEIESLACGRPVITTAVGIVPEIVIDGENGIIIKITRSNLREAIEAMLEDKELVNRLATSIGNALDGRYAVQMAASYDSMFEFVYRFQQEGVP